MEMQQLRYVAVTGKIGRNTAHCLHRLRTKDRCGMAEAATIGKGRGRISEVSNRAHEEASPPVNSAMGGSTIREAASRMR